VIPRNHTNARRSIIEEAVVTPSTLGEQNPFGVKKSFKKSTDPEPAKIYDSPSSSSSSDDEEEGEGSAKKKKSYLNHPDKNEEDEDEQEEYRRLAESGKEAFQRRQSMPMPVDE